MKSKAPKAPNYAALAKQQSDDQMKIAEYLTEANRPTQVDAFGNKLSWTKDPTTGQWTQTQQWSDDVKAQFQSQIENVGAAGGIYADILNKIGTSGDFKLPDLPQYDENSGRAVSDATYNAYRSRAVPEQERRTSALDAQLRMQGVQPGTEAYDRAMRNQMTSNADADYQAAQQATLTGYDEARQRYLAQLQGQGQDFGQKLTQYNLPWQQAQMAQSMASDRYTPQTPGFSGATGWNAADTVGAANANFSNKMAGYNSQQQKKGQTLGAGATLGAAFLSDEELKDEINELDGRQALEDLLAIGGYSWVWKENGEPDVGVIAQRVQKVLQDAVDDGGEYLRVNYTALVGKCIAALGYLATKGGA